MQFTVKALGSDGQIVNLSLDASSMAQAHDLAQRDGYKVLSVRALKKLSWPSFQFSEHFALSVFSKELLSLLNAGMSQVEALETLVDEKSTLETRRMLKGILKTLYEGRSLSTALEQYPKAFPKLYVELIRASEKTGGMTETIHQYIRYQEKIDSLRKKVVNASIYPMILIIAGFLVCSFLMFYVVPRFSEIYKDMGRDLPFVSRLLMQLGGFLGEYVVLFLLTFMTAMFFIFQHIKKNGLLNTILNWVSKVPMIGAQVRIHQLALLYRTVSILLKAGINIVPALILLEGILKKDMLSNEIKARQAISEGKTVSSSMLEANLTTPVGYKLLRVGEKSGKLAELTEHIADYYDEDISRWLDWFTKLFEPLLMAVIGIVIGFIVVVMYFPIFDIASNVQ